MFCIRTHSKFGVKQKECLQQYIPIYFDGINNKPKVLIIKNMISLQETNFEASRPHKSCQHKTSPVKVVNRYSIKNIWYFSSYFKILNINA